MPIFTIERLNCNDKGASSLVRCPKCKEEVEMRMFDNEDQSILTLVLDKEKHQYIAVCPKCASVFSVKPEYVKAKSEGVTVFATEDDFTPLAQK